ncbi:TetR/AcrR family transcriptional regulator [Cohnella faecalis]|uniref:TetR/AcrR family transcriptional regulator n=1 Tax=Cohnella faecalis TaxID=2315694 RepID=A0A398CWX8_9BACL|nr:TetR/AcrR family transcriptional regulator [Cohnella faecalis]RIE04337.1 TetR/AcrR family transcriptional regulator [Cohnella faecalis]
MKDPLELWLTELLEKQEGERRTEKQSRILRAAVEVFAEKGYSGAATNEIAQRAGVAEGTIFRHYRTKKDLLYSIVAPFVAKLIEPFVLKDLYSVIDSPHETFEGFIRGMLENRIAFAEKNLKIIRILIQEVPFHDELREQFLNRVGEKVLQRLDNVVSHYREQGQIVELPSLTVVRLVASSLLGYLLVRFILAPKSGWDDSAEREATIQFILRGLGR